MKVCVIFICMHFAAGRGYQENHWADLAIELGHEVMIITTDLTSPDLRGEMKDEARYGDNLIRIKSIRFARQYLFTQSEAYIFIIRTLSLMLYCGSVIHDVFWIGGF